MFRIAGIALLSLVLLSLALVGCASTTSSPTSSAPSTQSSASAPSAAKEKPIELKLDTQFSPGQDVYTALEKFVKRVETGTNGRVRITIVPASALASPNEVWKEIQAGVADMSNMLGNYQTTGFDLEKVSTSFTYGMPEEKFLKLRQEMMAEYAPVMAEYKGAKVLSAGYGGMFTLFTKDKPVRVPSDFKGLDMRVNMPLLIEMVNESGGNSIGAMPMGEVYMALQKGIIKGIITMDSALSSFKLGEVLKYRTDLSFGANLVGWTTAMNWDKWNSLPKDVQAVFEEAGKQLSADQTQVNIDGATTGLEFGKSKGMTLIEPTAQEREQWNAILLKAATRIADGYESKGIKAKEFQQKIEELKKR